MGRRFTKLANAEHEKRESCTAAARRYITERKWKPLPVSRGNKGPRAKGWPEWQIGNTDEYIAEHFDIPLPNVAIQMGVMSGGLTDIDLDCQEAVQLASQFDFLPKTAAVFGRASKRHSHHLYVTTLHETERRATIQYKENKELNAEEAMLVELRCGGGGKELVQSFRLRCTRAASRLPGTKKATLPKSPTKSCGSARRC